MILLPNEIAYGTSYWSSIVILVLSCPFQRYELFLVKSHFSIPHPCGQNFGCSFKSKSMILGSAKIEHLGLTSGEIFELSQPM